MKLECFKFCISYFGSPIVKQYYTIHLWLLHCIITIKCTFIIILGSTSFSAICYIKSCWTKTHTLMHTHIHTKTHSRMGQALLHKQLQPHTLMLGRNMKTALMGKRWEGSQWAHPERGGERRREAAVARRCLSPAGTRQQLHRATAAVTLLTTSTRISG